MNACIAKIVEVTTQLMTKFGVRDLNKVPLSRHKEKAGIWGEICATLFNGFQYSDSLRLKQWWNRDTHRFKSLVTEHLTNEQDMDDINSTQEVNNFSKLNIRNKSKSLKQNKYLCFLDWNGRKWSRSVQFASSLVSKSTGVCECHLLTQRMAPSSSSACTIVQREASSEELIYFNPQSEASRLRHILRTQEAVQLVQESVRPQKKR